MKNIDIKKSIAGSVTDYSTGLYSISECLKQINDIILYNTDNISCIDTRIEQQNKLYVYGLSRLHKAITKMSRK